MITARQAKILNTIIDEYINTALPVSSSNVFDTGIFDVSCPTIRNEMADLTERGYLAQPHTSAGRVPTEQGYRFFVDQIIAVRQAARDKGPAFAPVTSLGAAAGRQETRGKEQKTFDKAREISQKTDDLVIIIDGEDVEVKYLGLKKVFENPEFSTHGAVISMLEELERFESYIGTVEKYLRGDLDILIGSENPFFENPEYSMISSRRNNNFIALLGPMRMNYERNLSLLDF